VVQPAIMPAVERMLVPDALLRLGSKWCAEGGWDPTHE
jgi:hypothetical protein